MLNSANPRQYQNCVVHGYPTMTSRDLPADRLSPSALSIVFLLCLPPEMCSTMMNDEPQHPSLTETFPQIHSSSCYLTRYPIISSVDLGLRTSSESFVGWGQQPFGRRRGRVGRCRPSLCTMSPKPRRKKCSGSKENVAKAFHPQGRWFRDMHSPPQHGSRRRCA